MFAAVVAVAAAAGGWLARSLLSAEPVLTAATRLPSPRSLHQFTLLDSSGGTFDSTALAQKPSLLFFGFTQCPDVCPTTLALLAQLRRDPAWPGLRVVMISVDPQRDTPQVLRQYLQGFDPQFVGLTGNPDSVEALTRDVGVAVAQVRLPGGGYSIDHSATVFVTNAQGQLAAVFTPPLNRAAMLADLRALWPLLQHRR